MSYSDWMTTRSKTVRFGSVPVTEDLAGHLFPHQRDLVGWALRKGRCALFADTGLGKTAMQVEWARHVAKVGRVLILAPLAVADQTVREAARFGVDARYLRADDGQPGIVVANYEMLEHFDVGSFAGVVLDESSILKAYTGKMRNMVIDAFRDTPFRLACTATPAPNDFTELGNHSEFLGVKSRVEMLAEYFTHDGGSTQDWRVKGHAVAAFWRWVSTWGMVVRRPSDLGHPDGGFRLPALEMREHIIRVDHADAHTVGLLFAPTAATLSDQRATRRATMSKRATIAADLCGGDGPALVWCELNDEADQIEDLIPDAVQVRGSDSPEAKRDKLIGFSEGRYRVMVTKPSIAGFGMNWQHCNRMVFAGASHSFEQTYQAVRRCWRFGQQRPVTVHIIRAETEEAIMQNYRRKEADAETLAVELRGLVADAIAAEFGGTNREWNPYNPVLPINIPTWLE
jgi:hypothetical protein